MNSEAFWYRHPSGRVFCIDRSPDDSSWALYLDDELVCEGFGAPAEVAFKLNARDLDEEALRHICGMWAPPELDRWDTTEPDILAGIPNPNPNN